MLNGWGEDERDRLRGKIANFVIDHLEQVEDVWVREEGKKDVMKGKGREEVVKEQGRQATHMTEDEPRDHRLQTAEGDWVMVDNLEEMPKVKVMKFHKRAWEDQLEDWKQVFEQAIGKLSSHRQNSDSAALDSLVEAHAAVNERLRRF